MKIPLESVEVEVYVDADKKKRVSFVFKNQVVLVEQAYQIMDKDVDDD